MILVNALTRLGFIFQVIGVCFSDDVLLVIGHDWFKWISSSLLDRVDIVSKTVSRDPDNALRVDVTIGIPGLSKQN